jgi:hypothetical protein
LSKHTDKPGLGRFVAVGQALVETAAAVVFSLKRWRTAFSLKSGVLVYVHLFFGGHFLMEWFVGEGLKEVVVGIA